MRNLQIPPKSYFFREHNSVIQFKHKSKYGKCVKWINVETNNIYFKRLISTCACYEWISGQDELRCEQLVPILGAWRKWGGLKNA